MAVVQHFLCVNGAHQHGSDMLSVWVLQETVEQVTLLHRRSLQQAVQEDVDADASALALVPDGVAETAVTELLRCASHYDSRSVSIVALYLNGLTQDQVALLEYHKVVSVQIDAYIGDRVLDIDWRTFQWHLNQHVTCEGHAVDIPPDMSQPWPTCPSLNCVRCC